MTPPLTKTAWASRLGALGAAASIVVGAATVGSAAASGGRPRSATVSAGTLTVTGTDHDDRISLLLAAGAPGTLQVDFDDDGTPDLSFDRSQFTAIHVSLRNGDDEFRIDQRNGSIADEAITVEGGNGDDVLAGGDGAELFVGGAGDDAVDGNRGNDSAVLGTGDDTFTWDQGDGSDVVEGSAGFDTLVFNGATGDETMALAAAGAHAVFTRVQGSIRMDLHGVERLAVSPLGGADSFSVGDVSGTDLRATDVDLSGPDGGGDAAVDTVTVAGTPRADRIDVRADGDRVRVDGVATTVRITGSEPNDRLQIAAGDGRDAVHVGDDVARIVTVSVDLGAGQR